MDEEPPRSDRADVPAHCPECGHALSAAGAATRPALAVSRPWVALVVVLSLGAAWGVRMGTLILLHRLKAGPMASPWVRRDAWWVPTVDAFLLVSPLLLVAAIIFRRGFTRMPVRAQVTMVVAAAALLAVDHVNLVVQYL